MSLLTDVAQVGVSDTDKHLFIRFEHLGFQTVSNAFQTVSNVFQTRFKQKRT